MDAIRYEAAAQALAAAILTNQDLRDRLGDLADPAVLGEALLVELEIGDYIVTDLRRELMDTIIPGGQDDDVTIPQAGIPTRG